MSEHSHKAEDVIARISAPTRPGALKDAVYGAIDGAVTTFAIVAGVAGAGLSPKVILALGFANVLADGFSMAAANYYGTKAEQDNIRRLRQVEGRHIDAFPKGERLEAREILRGMGLTGHVLEDATDAITSNRENWINLMMSGEYGVSGVELQPLRAALVTFAAFLVVGLVPLLPFVFGATQAFAWSVSMTMASFFAIGALKSVWSLTPWWRSGLETFLIGGCAALLAFAVGSLFDV